MNEKFFQIITDTNNELEVYEQGAKTFLTLSGNIILGDFIRGDGKHGITHPCTPIFGPDRKNIYGLNQHGNMRNEKCDVEEQNNQIVITHNLTDEGFPKGLFIKQKMKIEDGVYYFEMTHTNNGEETAALNTGEHCYFDAPQGFRGTIINGKDISELIENNYDGIAIDLLERNIIQIPGKPEYTLDQLGFKKAVVWVGKNPQTKEIDQTYVCIEPVEQDPFGDYFGSPESLLTPGQSRTCTFSLTAK